MFKYKNAMISMAVVAMLAACGGGGGGSDDPDNGNPSNPPAGGGSTVLENVDLSNPLTLSPSSGVLIPQGSTFIEQTYTGFNSTTPRDDGTGYGLYGYQDSDDAPIAAFAIRVDPLPADATLAENDVKTGRVAFDMRDQASVANGQVLTILIDQVSTTVTPAGELSISVPADAQLTVYAKNEAGGQATVTVPAADVADLITATSVGAGSEEYNIVLNVDAAVAAAKAAAAGADAGVLANVVQFNSGAEVPFEVAFTMTNANIVTGATGDQGKVIAVGDRTVAAQGGINGYIQVGATATPETTAAP